MKTTHYAVTVVWLFSISATFAEEFSAKQLNDWDFYGVGKKGVDSHGIFLMKETPNSSKGVMVVSPKSYGTDVVLKYDVMALTAPTVCVVILSASDKGKTDTVTIPQKYDGDVRPWINKYDNYFFSFRNEAHNHHPGSARQVAHNCFWVNPCLVEVGPWDPHRSRAAGFRQFTL